MVWEQNSRVIVMLTRLIEKGNVCIQFRFNEKKYSLSYLVTKDSYRNLLY